MARWRDIDHGDACDCMRLALAVGAPPAATDYLYCRYVLQRHWRLTCTHGCREPMRPLPPPPLPRLDPKDKVQAALIANAPRPDATVDNS